MIEQEFLEQLRLSETGDVIIDPSQSTSAGVHVIHSRNEFWDAMLPEAIYDKYSRRRVASNQRLSTAVPSNLTGLFNHEAAAPFLNLLPEHVLAELSIVEDDYDTDQLDDLTLLYERISFVLKSTFSVVSTLHVALFSITTLCFGIFAATAITALTIGYQVYQVMCTQYNLDNATKNNQETPSSNFQRSPTIHCYNKVPDNINDLDTVLSQDMDNFHPNTQSF